MSNQNTEKKDPFIRIAQIKNVPKKRKIFVRIAAVLVAFLAVGLFVNIVGNISLFTAIKEMFKGTFGDFKSIKSVEIKMWDTAIYTAKLLVIAVALTPAFKMRFWNIGAEGQIIIGSLVTAFVMHNLGDKLSTPVLYIFMFLGCMAAGTLWGIIPAIFKAKWGTNETLFTLMLNYVAAKIMDYFYNSWKGLNSALDKINRTTEIGYLPSIFKHRTTISIIIFVILAILMYFYINKTKQGYEICVVGESVNTARYAGINVPKVIIRTMAISGLICGLCGGLTVAGQTFSISYSGDAVNTITNGYGFTAIIVSWLANFNTLSMIAYSLLVVFLEKGAGQLGNTYSVFSLGAGKILIGIVLFVLIGSEFFIRYKVIFNDKTRNFFEKTKNGIKDIFKKKVKEENCNE